MTPHDPAEVLSALLENSRFGVLALDAAGQIRAWSRGAARLLGWESQEMLGRSAEAALQLRELPQGQARLSLPKKDGTLVDVECFAGPWPNSAGQGVVAIVTEFDPAGAGHTLARLEQELRQVTARSIEAQAEARTERRFRELLEAAPDAIIEVDQQGRILLLNPATEVLFGYGRQELLGQTVEMLVPESVRAAHAEHRARYWSGPVTRPMGSGLSLEGRRKDGSTFPVEISLSPVKSEDGTRVTAIIRDITERRQAERQIREIQQTYTQELESRNQEVERANQLKSEFLASMSHELRTPLHTIIGFAELLAEELEGGNQKHKRYVDHIHTDSLHLLALINDVLDISKIESGRLELRREVFDPVGALEETLSSIRPQGAAKSIAFETHLSIPGAIFADPLRYKQILFNLLSNAVKFTPPGGRIRIEGRLCDGFLEMSVSDTGIGIPREQHEAVFDKFYQVGATTKGVREGTGLGLAITKALVEEHGGRIWIESEPGKGSRFTFTIQVEDV